MMMLPFTVMAAFSCTSDLDQTVEIENNSQLKITNTPADVCQESILVLAASGTTQDDLSSALEGLCTLERVFPDVPGTEAQAAAFRLDRWYKATVSEDIDIVSLAKKAAKDVNLASLR